ncbi:Essential protein Yae1, N terminal [Bachmanniomyces sp. S44760]|nr:Essential protein Yae1, N terminal [Bachmanniomyces sp. S44760]
MLRDDASFSVSPIFSEAVNRSPSPPTVQRPNAELFDDVFASASSSSSHIGESESNSRADEISDIPRLRSTQVTAGYREGIASSKEKSIQTGFDEGYSLGAVLGLRVGYILGLLESIYKAVETRGDPNDDSRKKECFSVLDQAKKELDLIEVFGRDVWGEDGVWTYEVRANDGAVGEEAAEITFEEVADQHPILSRWNTRVDDLVKEWGVTLGRFEGEEWENGRVDEGTG